MVGLSDEELRQYVLDYTLAYYPSLSGTPEILLLRVATAQDFRQMGFPEPRFMCEAPPMTVAIVRGDF